MSQKNYLLGGIILCIFPALILLAAYAHGELKDLYLAEIIFLADLFLWGIYTLVLSLFKFDEKGIFACVAGSILVAGIAAMFFVIAWREKNNWGSNIPFLPDAWKSIIARLLFALGGVLATIGVIFLLRKAIGKRRNGDAP